jgi:hypothetical protein
VRDEHVMVRVGSGQLFEVGAAEARLRAVEAGAARPLAEALEHCADRGRVAAAERPHDKRRASLRFDDPGVHVLRVSSRCPLDSVPRAGGRLGAARWRLWVRLTERRSGMIPCLVRTLSGGFELDDDPARIDRVAVHGYLSGESLDRRPPHERGICTGCTRSSASRRRTSA